MREREGMEGARERGRYKERKYLGSKAECKPMKAFCKS